MRRLRVLLLGVLVLVASACRVDTTVEVAVAKDGSGTVAVTVVADAAAVARLSDAPDRLRFDDLEQAGWLIDGPTVDSAGAMTVTATKVFPTAQALPGILAEIAGPDVLFRDVELARSRSFDRIGLGPAKTHYALTGTLDPRPDIEDFARGVPESVSFPTRAAIIEAGLADGDELGVRFVVRLPDIESTTTGEVDDESIVWTASYGDPPIDLSATSSVSDILPRVWAVVALLAGLLFVGILAARLSGYVLAKLRTPKGRRRRDVRRRQNRAASRAEEANRPRRRMLRLLVVDVHGVLVRPADPLDGLLLPLITKERPDADPAQVRTLYHRLVLGRISPEEFWAEVGLGPVADEIETRYLSSYRLVPGLHPFLDRMSTSGLPVAAVANQPRVWGDRLRRMASLDDALASWMVSGDVGSVLPEPALFEATRRRMSVDLFDCFYLSNVPGNLDAAAELGMATGLFVTGAEQAPETEHTVVRGFEDLLRSRG
ncbi:MAG: hypothetical protein R2695_17320 [Acidimicrobiales bacterium]